MKYVKQISSLEKVRHDSDMNYNEIFYKNVLQGERVSWQIAIKSDEHVRAYVKVISPLSDYVKLFYVENAVMDAAAVRDEAFEDDGYITKEPGIMPDILKPINEAENIWMSYRSAASLWVEADIPKGIKAGEREITISFEDVDSGEEIIRKTMTVNVSETEIMPQSLIYTRWFYADCIADFHGVEVYSERHWELIEGYIKAAADIGINMILVPIHTPPLDTAPGTFRTCVQLVKIEKCGDKYFFDFEKFKRFIDICKKCGIRYFEMAHMFSQWGAKSAPNIKVSENGKESYMFGEHTNADSEEYTDFLKQYISAISKELEKEGIIENTYFHISDEPGSETMETYKRAAEIIIPLIGNAKTFDALTEYEFYEKGLVKCPVTCVNHLKTFLEHNVENQWTYYCNIPQSVYPNGFMAMPSGRVRIMGFLMYKYNIKGFLHWGFNFYNGMLSRYKLNPYTTTSANGRYPSGDAFVVYPSRNGAYKSIRGAVFYEGIEDMEICRTLEKYTGREAVIKMIDDEAGYDVTFEKYPVDNSFFENLREVMIKRINGE